jgi:predicted P-loop ATPase
MLVLFGDQGVGKSRFFRALSPNPEWFTDAIVLKFGRGDTAHRDQEVLLQGKWVVEIPELAGIWKSDDNDTKNWLTLQSPRVSKKYDPDATELPRRVLFGGSTNLDGVIQDATGSRRFAFLTIGGYKIDIKWIEEHREQIWAQAKVWFDAGEQWWFNDEEFASQVKENQNFKRSHPWEPMVDEWAADKSRFTNDDIYDYVLHMPADRRGHKDNIDIGNILKSLGFKKQSIRVDGKSFKGWVHPNQEIDNLFIGTRWKHIRDQEY